MEGTDLYRCNIKARRANPDCLCNSRSVILNLTIHYPVLSKRTTVPTPKESLNVCKFYVDSLRWNVQFFIDKIANS